MDRRHFRGILRKYLQSRATPEEEEMIDSWYAEMGKNEDQGEQPTLEDKYWSGISSHVRKGKSRRLTPWTSVGIAASLVIAAATILFLALPGKEQPAIVTHQEEKIGKWQRILNTGEISERITLSDGSKVVLEPGSQLKIPFDFNEYKRPVYLKGEAFFEVSRDENRPFLVHTNGLMTKVLGTSFRVKAFEDDKNVTVAVKTGKVSVSTSDGIEKDSTKANAIILTPNQQIVYDKELNKLSRMIVEKPQAILPQEELRKMRFEGAPVTEIFQAIEKVYGVKLVYTFDDFSSCKLTSVISDGDLYNRLDIICKAIGATYSIRENEVVIHGTGCDAQ